MTLYYYGYFREWVKYLDNKVLGYNLLIRLRVQLYFYSGTCYSQDGNFRLVKS